MKGVRWDHKNEVTMKHVFHKRAKKGKIKACKKAGCERDKRGEAQDV